MHFNQNVVFLSGVFLLGIAGCDSTLDRPIHFKIPNGFSGPILLLNSDTFPAAIQKTTSAYVVTIPNSGVLRLSDAKIFRRWHRTQASYMDGTRLSVWGENADVRFHECSTGTSNNHTYDWFFVGSEAERDSFFALAGMEKEEAWLRERGIKSRYTRGT